MCSEVASFATAGTSIKGMSDSIKSISVVRPSQFQSGTLQTSGSTRLAAIPGALNVDSPMWAGTFLVEPGAKTGVHHHGEQDTVVYVLEGESLVRWGEKGSTRRRYMQGTFCMCRRG